jgi:hypothetical protein
MSPQTVRQADPGAHRDEPIDIEHYQLGKDLKAALALAEEEVEMMGDIAIDLHDLLRAADKLRDVLAPQLIAAKSEDRDELRKLIREMAFEFEHVAWHCSAAVECLDQVSQKLQ